MAGRYVTPYARVLDDNGNPISGAKLNFYISGTSTRQDTFSDDGLTTANANPVVADGVGRFPNIFLKQADYKVVLTDANDAQIWTADPVRSNQPKNTQIKNVSTTYQVAAGDDGALLAADASLGSFVITLLPVAEAGNGFEIAIQKVDSSTNTVTVDGNGAETINGASDVTLEKQYETVILRSNGTRWLSPLKEGAALPTNYISGLELSNGATPAIDIAVSAGSMRSDDDQTDIVLPNAITKKINAAFAEGNNQGGLDTGVVAADTTYDVYAISKADGTADVLISTKGTAPSLPSGFVNKAFIGRCATDGASNIIPNMFTQQRVDGQYYYGEQDTSSGNTKEFFAFPTGPDHISVDFDSVSPVANSVSLDMQIGGDTSLDTSSTYRGQATNFTTFVTYSTAYRLIVNTGAATFSEGLYQLSRSDTAGQIYSLHGAVGYSNGGSLSISAGIKDLSTQAFSRMSFAWASGDFDNGRIAVTAFKAGAYTP